MLHDELLHKWINNTISESELEAFKQRPEYDSLVELYKQTDGIKPPTFNADKVLENILSDSSKEKESSDSKVFRLPVWIKLAVAASFILAVALFFFPKNDDFIRYHTSHGESIVVELPDGSSVEMNERSTLSYYTENWQSIRQLSFSGDALFNVQKGERFIVETELGEVEVLGTSFHVKTLSKTLNVLCQSGKVAVRSSDQVVEEILIAGESIRLKDDKMIQLERANLVRFKDVPFYEVLESFQRDFKVRITPKDIRLSTKLSCNYVKDDLESAIKSITLPMDLKYEFQDDKSIILTK